MTSLLRRALSEAETLTEDDRDANASLLLAEVEDERGWAERFAATTDDQWDRIIARVRRDVANRGTFPLDGAFPADEAPE